MEENNIMGTVNEVMEETNLEPVTEIVKVNNKTQVAALGVATVVIVGGVLLFKKLRKKRSENTVETEEVTVEPNEEPVE